MRPSCPEVGRSQRPNLIAAERGRRRLSSSANPATSSTNSSRANTSPQALLDQTKTAALPRDRVHLTHGTCRGAAIWVASSRTSMLLGLLPALVSRLARNTELTPLRRCYTIRTDTRHGRDRSPTPSRRAVLLCRRGGCVQTAPASPAAEHEAVARPIGL